MYGTRFDSKHHILVQLAWLYSVCNTDLLLHLWGPLGAPKGPSYDVLGVFRGVKGGLLDLYRARFAPLEVLYSIRFGTKHYIMIQLAKVYWVGITDPFLDLWAPLGAPKGPFMSKQVVLRLQIVPKLTFWPLKRSSDGPKQSNLVQNAPHGRSPQVKCILDSINGI